MGVRLTTCLLEEDRIKEETNWNLRQWIKGRESNQIPPHNKVGAPGRDDKKMGFSQLEIEDQVLPRVKNLIEISKTIASHTTRRKKVGNHNKIKIVPHCCATGGGRCKRKGGGGGKRKGKGVPDDYEQWEGEEESTRGQISYHGKEDGHKKCSPT